MIKRCGVCDKEFDALGARKFCSKACSTRAKQYSWRKSKQKSSLSVSAEIDDVKTCAFCGDKYLRSDGGYKFCSTECSYKNGLMTKNARQKCRKYGSKIVDSISFSQVYEMFGGRCNICGIETPINKRGFFCDNAPEQDHVIPISRGGHHAFYNIQLLCRSCNIDKSNKITDRELKHVELFWPVPYVRSSGYADRNK